MMDYSFLDGYEKQHGEAGTPGELMQSWFDLLDGLTLVLLAKNAYVEGQVRSRRGYVVPKEKLVDALSPVKLDAKPDPVSGQKLRSMYESVVKLGKEYAAKQDHILLCDLLYQEVFTPVERLALIAACAPRLQRKYEQVFAELSGDDHCHEATAGAVLDLYGLMFDDSDLAARILMDRESFLNRFLLRQDEVTGFADSGLSRKLVPNPFCLKEIMGVPSGYGAMREYADLIEVSRNEETIVNTEGFERLRTVLSGNLKGLVLLPGNEGLGRKYLVSAVMREQGRYAVRIRLDALLTLDNKQLSEALDELLYQYYLQGPLYVLETSDGEALNPDRLQFVITRLQSVLKLLVVSADSWPRGLFARGEQIRIALDPPGRGKQEILWKEIAARKGVNLDPEVRIAELVSKYNLLPGQIAAVLEVLRYGEASVSQRTIENEINAQAVGGFGSLATKISNGFTVSDIFLTDEAGKQVKKVIDRVRFAAVVNDEYGFGKNLPYGKGISVLLYGPPGTGKTMLASVIANELNMPLYRIDLSQIGSKYVGETEKNLGELFEAAKRSNGILFFDEADSLFAKRTGVSNSNDRYANAETGYLLQQIEGYAGLSILATNAMQNFDNAFKRRMTFMIPVEAPNEEERLNLWEHVFPEHVKLAKDVDFAPIAKLAELTGSSIKAAALDAAYAAAARDGVVTSEDLIEAVDTQCRRNGISGIGNTIRFESVKY